MAEKQLNYFGLDVLRGVIPPTAREKFYVVVAALVGVLGFTEGEAAVWTQVGVAAVTLLFALLYSSSTVRASLYAVLVAVSTAGQLYGYFTETQWASYLGLAAALLGIATAAAKAPTTTIEAVQTGPNSYDASADPGYHVGE